VKFFELRLLCPHQLSQQLLLKTLHEM
jgi:hypothetical protein